MKHKPDIIGSIEKIDFPELGLIDVAAKIDTGADSSAVWASDIQESKGELSFVLFGKPSPFYTGKIITTNDFKISSIKNSFGQTEFRYRVKLKTKLAGRTIWASFTLANRENNKFPVLVGRRTIQGKFLVDVTQSAIKGTCRVLLLCIKKTETVQKYVESLEAKGKSLDITTATYDEINITVAKSPAVKLAGGQDLADFDVVYFKTAAHSQDIAASIAQYLKTKHVPFVDRAVQNFPATGKLHQYVILASHGVPVPKSYFMTAKRLAKSFDVFADELGLPFILKDIHGRKGNANYLIDDKTAFKTAVSDAKKARVQLIGQAFVPNGGDYRLLVLGKAIELVIYRQGEGATHLNNTSRGGKAALTDLSKLPADVQKQSIVAAELLERQIAGVDMVQDKHSGKWYCLEVNDGPQLATGTFLPQKHAAVARFIESKLKGF